MTAPTAERISARVAIDARRVEDIGFPILKVEAESLHRQVQREVMRRIGDELPLQRTYYVTYEEVIGQADDGVAA